MSPRFVRRSTSEQSWEHFRDRWIRLNLQACPSRRMSKWSAIYGSYVSKTSKTFSFFIWNLSKNDYFSKKKLTDFHQKYGFRSVFLTIWNSFCRTCTFFISWTYFHFTMKVCYFSIIVWMQSIKFGFFQDVWNWKSNGMKFWISFPIFVEKWVAPFAREGLGLRTDGICVGRTKLVPEKGRVVSGFCFF